MNADLTLCLSLKKQPDATYAWVLDVREGEGYEPIIDRKIIPARMAQSICNYVDVVLNPTGPCKVGTAAARSTVEARRRMEQAVEAIDVVIARRDALLAKLAEFDGGFQGHD